MFKYSVVLGVCLSLIACAAPASDDPGVEESGPEQVDPGIVEALDDSALQTAGKKGGDDGPTIPAPTYGYIKASTSNGTSCAWSLDGSYKGTGSTITVLAGTGLHDVACKRADGVTVYKNDVMVYQSGTTILTLSFPSTTGTLVAVAVGGSCTFSVNGVVKGSGATVTVTLPAPATYSVSCAPVSGATKSRSVTVSPDQTAMAMFKL
jgi:hypothetical protein